MYYSFCQRLSVCWKCMFSSLPSFHRPFWIFVTSFTFTFISDLRMYSGWTVYPGSIVTGLEMLWWSSRCNSSFISHPEDNPASHSFHLHYYLLVIAHCLCSNTLGLLQVFIKSNLNQWFNRKCMMYLLAISWSWAVCWTAVLFESK